MTGPSSLASLLELLHEGALRSSSVRATLVERSDTALTRAAFERFDARRHGGGGRARLVSFSEAAEAEEPAEHVSRIRLWAEPPGRRRTEHESRGFSQVTVVDGERWWSRGPHSGLQSWETHPGVEHGGGLALLDGAPWAADCVLEPGGEAEACGRRARGVRARRRPWVRHGLAESFGPMFDEAELLVDAERGLLLRRAVLFDGRPATTMEVEEIAFDEPLPPETWRLEVDPAEEMPPEGTTPRFTTLDAAAALASFRVWKIDPVPTGWRVHAVYLAGAEELRLPESVTLLYSRPDGGEHLQVHQSVEEPWSVEGTRTVERGGRTFALLGPEEPEGREPSQLLFDLYGTRVRMSSGELGAERLLELAAALVEA